MGVLRCALTLATVASRPVRGCAARPGLPDFSGERALADAATQVAMGPRVPGTPAHAEARAWLVAELAAAGGSPTVQALPDSLMPLPAVDTLYNVRARFGPASGPYVVLGAHWDTRPWADRDPDETRRSAPVPGGNDGASGVAVLLEVARVLGRTPPPVGVEIVFFDAEDAGRGTHEEEYCRGSRGYVARLSHPWPLHAIVVDMVGRRGAAIHREGNSMRAAPYLVDRLWEAAEKTHATVFRPGVRHFVYDDHAPFIEAGIPAADLIDLDDPSWHTSADGAENLDAATLAEVGRVLLWHLYTLEVAVP